MEKAEERTSCSARLEVGRNCFHRGAQDSTSGGLEQSQPFADLLDPGSSSLHYRILGKQTSLTWASMSSSAAHLLPGPYEVQMLTKHEVHSSVARGMLLKDNAAVLAVA